MEGGKILESEEMLKTLVMVLIGLFFPFFFAIGFVYSFEIGKLITAFAYLLFLFCIEAVVVYIAMWKRKRKARKKKNNVNDIF